MTHSIITQLISRDKEESSEVNLTINELEKETEIIIENDQLTIKESDEYPFFALVKIRKVLEQKGYFLLINGNRLSVYPSGMQYDTYSAYELELGIQAIVSVDIFDKPDDSKQISTVKEQEEFFNSWIESLG